MKVKESCSCGGSIELEDVDDPFVQVERWRSVHRCQPAPWRSDPSGSSGAATQIGFRRSYSDVRLESR